MQGEDGREAGALDLGDCQVCTCTHRREMLVLLQGDAGVPGLDGLRGPPGPPGLPGALAGGTGLGGEPGIVLGQDFAFLCVCVCACARAWVCMRV